MKLESLCEMSLAYRGEFIAQKSFGASGGGYGAGDGVVTGERLSGAVRWSNHPTLREDDVFQPDGAGVIATPEGVSIVFRIRGYSVRTAPSANQRAFTVWLALHTEHPSHRWLNTTFAVGEGRIDFATMTMRMLVFACRNEIAFEPAPASTAAAVAN